KALSVTVSAKIPTAVAVEDAPESVPEGRTAPALVFRQGDTLVSIRDSVTLEFEAADADGDLSGHAWNCGEGGNFRDSAFLSGRHAAIRIGLRFADPGTRLCSVRVWDGEGGSIRKEVRIRVELDPPWADAGTDTLVAAG